MKLQVSAQAVSSRGVAATSTRDLSVDLEEVQNSQLPVAAATGRRSGRSADKVSEVGLLLAQTSPHGNEAICVCNLHAAEESGITASGGSNLHGLDRRTSLFAVARDMTKLVAQEALALVFLERSRGGERAGALADLGA